jgi:hypothetical protein
MPTSVSILEAFSQSYPGLIQLLTVVAYLLGMWAGGSALLKLWRRQRYEPDATTGGIVMRSLTCAVFLYLPTAIASGQATVFGEPTILSYTSGSALSASGQIVVKTVLGFVQIVGLWAFLWGFMLLNHAHARGSYEPGLGTKGATHIVGGILAMNSIATLKMAAETFGLQTLLQYIVD